MKKLITIILAIMLNLVILGNSFAYKLTDSDKKSANNITNKLESFISKKGENYRNILVERLKKIDSSKSEKFKAYVDYIILALDIDNNSLDSKEAIFQKIEDDLKKKELESQSGIQPEIKNILVQGDFKAEYISNNGDYTKSDKIRITQNGKSWEIPGVYDLEDKSDDNLVKVKCQKEETKKSPGIKIPFMSCGVPVFGSFGEFSPSGYYLSINSIGGEGVGGFRLLNTKTGKSEIIPFGFITFNGWTKDKNQFIYGLAGRSFDIGLYITEKGNFPKTKKLLKDEEILGGYIDEKNIYVKTNSIDIDPKTQVGNDKFFYKIIDIETEKVIYSQEITQK